MVSAHGGSGGRETVQDLHGEAEILVEASREVAVRNFAGSLAVGRCSRRSQHFLAALGVVLESFAEDDDCIEDFVVS